MSDIGRSHPHDLHGRVAIVTNGGAPENAVTVGMSCAVLLARAGARIAIVDRDRDWAQRTADLVHTEGGAAIIIAADLTTEAGCKAVVAQTVDRWQRIDFISTTVGGPRPTMQGETTFERADRHRDEAMAAIQQLSDHALPLLRERGGAIVNISILDLEPTSREAAPNESGPDSQLSDKLDADSGEVHPPDRSVAIITLSHKMAAAHAADGVRVNSIASSSIQSRALARTTLASGEATDEVAAPTDLAWQIAHTAVFLLSDAADGITGQTIVVDGGAGLKPPR